MGAFESEYPFLFAIAYRAGFRLTGVREDAEDIAIEALARAAWRWERITADGRDAAPWVARVASNLAIDLARRHARRRGTSDARVESRITDSDDLERLARDRSELVDALRHLPRRQREAVVLRFICDVSEAETAALLGCSVGTVKTHVHRGLAALRLTLEIEETS